MKYNDNTVFASVINISAILHLSFTSIIYIQEDFKKAQNPLTLSVLMLYQMNIS